MPYLGPGVGQTIQPTALPTWVFTPTPGQAATVRITNNSANIVYLGGSNVSQYNGLPLPPGNRPVELQNCPFTVYTAAAAFPSGNNTTISGSQVQGVSAFTAAAGTGLYAGGTLQVGNGTNLEYVVVSTIVNLGGTTGTSTVTTTTPFLYDHAASSTVSTVTVRPGNVTVSAGIV